MLEANAAICSSPLLRKTLTVPQRPREPHDLSNTRQGGGPDEAWDHPARSLPLFISSSTPNSPENGPLITPVLPQWYRSTHMWYIESLAPSATVSGEKFTGNQGHNITAFAHVFRKISALAELMVGSFHLDSTTAFLGVRSSYVSEAVTDTKSKQNLSANLQISVTFTFSTSFTLPWCCFISNERIKAFGKLKVVDCQVSESILKSPFCRAVRKN